MEREREKEREGEKEIERIESFSRRARMVSIILLWRKGWWEWRERDGEEEREGDARLRVTWRAQPLLYDWYEEERERGRMGEGW
jgi:hypothetical protein